MIFRVYDPCNDKLHIFTTKEKAEEYIEYLRYFIDENVVIDIQALPEDIDIVTDITRHRLFVYLNRSYPTGENPHIDGWVMGRVHPTKSALGAVQFTMSESSFYQGYTHYCLSKVYKVQKGESPDDFHKRVLEDMNKELARQIAKKQKGD